MVPKIRPVDPRLRVLYLVAVAVGAFFVKSPRFAIALALGHVFTWLLLGLGVRPLARAFFKLWGFAAFVSVSYALTAEDPAIDRWIPIYGHFRLNFGGLVVGLLMIVRVVTVVLASRIARAGDERAVAVGLGRLGAPEVVALSIDTVLALLGGGGGGGGGGNGLGGGRGKGQKQRVLNGEGFLGNLRRIARGDVLPIVERIERHIERAERYLGDRGSRDIAIIVGISLTMLGIKALKLLPSVPFAPGHKLVLLTPLYVIATLKTRTRFGATLTGLVMGTVAFLLGDGRYGIFEIAKHVMPGLVCDLVVPFVLSGRGARSRLVWCIVGGMMGLGRFATIFVVTMLVQAPGVAWAFLVPGLVIHTTFGILSGLVSAPLLHAVMERTEEREGLVPTAMETTKS